MSTSRGVDQTYPVIEVYGPTVQGEGDLIGAPVHFVRFGYCDYRCSWCDSKYAVDPEEVRANAEQLTASEIVARLKDLDGMPEWIVFSGGNPAIHDLEPLVELCHAEDLKVTVETQGTVFRPWIRAADKVTVSPKPPSSGNVTTMQEVDWFSDQLRPRIAPSLSAGTAGMVESIPDGVLSYKVVIFDDADLEYLRGLVRHVPGRYPVFASVGNLVGEDSVGDLLEKWRWLAETVMRDPELRAVRALPQGHVLLWGNARGV